MQELNIEEINTVGGGQTLFNPLQWLEAMQQLARDFPQTYQDLVNGTTDCMCIFTGDC